RVLFRSVHHQHRWAGDAQDLHPRRDGPARAPRDPVRDRPGAGRPDLAGRLVRAERLGCPRAPDGAGPPRGRGARRSLVAGAADAVRAAAVTGGDMRLALDVRPEDLAEQVELSLAGGPVVGSDAMDRAIALDEADDAVGRDDRLGDVALLVLDDRELAGAVEEPGLRCESIGHALSDAVARHPAPLLEDAVDELLAADRPDRGQEAAGEAVVVGREEVL